MNKAIKTKKKIKMWVKSEKKKIKIENIGCSSGIAIVDYNLQNGEANLSTWSRKRTNTYWIKKYKYYPIDKIRYYENGKLIKNNKII